MKSGTGDDPFADDPVEDDGSAEKQAESSAVGTDRDDDRRPSRTTERAETTTTDRRGAGSVDTVSELPYKYRRDSVKELRTQQPMFLQDTTEELIDDTVDEMEIEFDEDVYKTDVVEAMLVAGAEGSTPAAVLRRWGYGMKNK
ncbi:hypothetical protein NDI85_18330 [Halomicroarcula sp. S1AR25-4]|uniref:hypothetical protein n=1 Tax=Haloarcula sp. S1AR25-4 TaxID=2950538 RepID=UPI0028740149|nr:hypothetical protein [Halomicroarcula sp. S1AR25-4]MDS0279755.1 hypothetical protein [Halomicroarcula sp. S1AR25-4]